MQSGESREVSGVLHALNHALWSFFIRNGWRIVWESRSPDRSFVLATSPWRTGSWKELARIDWLRGTPSDDKANLWWEQLYDSVPVFRMFSEDVDSTNTKRQRRGGVCGRELRGYPRASTKEAPFQNGATRRAGTRGCYFPFIRGLRREHASTDTFMELRRGPSTNTSGCFGPSRTDDSAPSAEHWWSGSWGSPSWQDWRSTGQTRVASSTDRPPTPTAGGGGAA